MYQHTSIAKIDAGTWERVVEGDENSFESVVVRHQAAVCAVAYNIVGDFAISQDIAQDTFWAAWSAREKLREAGKLKSWLCGIARNLAKQWSRKKFVRKEIGDEGISQTASATDTPLERFVSNEEEALVWKALTDVPENYREAVVLYYRQGKSINEVAEALDISSEAARQRLHRGREMLKAHVSKLVDGVLDRNNPGQSFTARVMAGVVGTSVAGQATTASAATSSPSVLTAVTLAKLIAGGSGLGLLGGLIGMSGGMFGAWLGTWLPAQYAPTETERQLLMERSRGIMRFATGFSLLVLLISLAFAFKLISTTIFITGILVASAVFSLWTVIATLKTQSLVQKLRKEISPLEDPNQSTFVKQPVPPMKSQPTFHGRKYTSPTVFLGLPLVDIQVASPPTPADVLAARSQGEKVMMPEPCVARGWIAIGDIAYGRLLAIGGRAVGGIAIGGLAIGLISIGGLSCGLLTLGGLALGGWALGGLAVGWVGVGGGAIAWMSATGGVAAAVNFAAGGLAIAYEFAFGGVAWAKEANTELARVAIEDNTWINQLKSPYISLAIAPLLIGFSALTNKLMYYKDDLLPMKDSIKGLDD